MNCFPCFDRVLQESFSRIFQPLPPSQKSNGLHVRELKLRYAKIYEQVKITIFIFRLKLWSNIHRILTFQQEQFFFFAQSRDARVSNHPDLGEVAPILLQNPNTPIGEEKTRF